MKLLAIMVLSTVLAVVAVLPVLPVLDAGVLVTGVAVMAMIVPEIFFRRAIFAGNRFPFGIACSTRISIPLVRPARRP